MNVFPVLMWIFKDPSFNRDPSCNTWNDKLFPKLSPFLQLTLYEMNVFPVLIRIFKVMETNCFHNFFPKLFLPLFIDYRRQMTTTLPRELLSPATVLVVQ